MSEVAVYEAEGNEFVEMIRTVTELPCVQTLKCTAILFKVDLLTNACSVCTNVQLVLKMQAIRNNVKLALRSVSINYPQKIVTHMYFVLSSKVCVLSCLCI